MVLHVEPPSVDLSILYPVIAEPPLFPAVHDKLILECDIAVAERSVGGFGTLGLLAGLVHWTKYDPPSATSVLHVTVCVASGVIFAGWPSVNVTVISLFGA